jgi:hypothetical protein
MIIEGFKDIKDFEGLYSVNRNGDVLSIRNNILLKQWDTLGYKYVSLGANCKKRVHRLVAEAFIPNIENKPEINHINGIKHDNRYINLCWCTSHENKIHAYKTGLHKNKINAISAMKKSRRKFNNEEAYRIKNEYINDGLSMRKLANKYNVNFHTIFRLVNSKTYQEI